MFFNEEIVAIHHKIKIAIRPQSFSTVGQLPLAVIELVELRPRHVQPPLSTLRVYLGKVVDLLPELAVIGVVRVVIGKHTHGFGVEDWSEGALLELTVLFLFY